MEAPVQLAALLPAACTWAEQMEARILRAGVALTEAQRGDAKALGVRSPAQVRVLLVPTIPTPAHGPLAEALTKAQIVTSATQGLTLHHGILIRADAWADHELLAHELVHVEQYERRGGLAPFLTAYLAQVVQYGYWAAPMEQAARRKAKALVSTSISG